MSKIPKVVSTGEINLGGFIMHVHQLDNGQRVIDVEDVEKFFSPDNTVEMTPEIAFKLASLVKGNGLVPPDPETTEDSSKKPSPTRPSNGGEAV